MVDWALVVEALKAIAWPIVAIYAVRKIDVGALARRLKKLKSGDKEVEFDVPGKLEPGPPPPAALPPGPTGEKALPPPIAPESPPEPVIAPAAEDALIEFSPAGAVINAWSRVEDVLRQTVLLLNAADAISGAIGQVVEELVRLGVVDKATRVLIDRLRHLRNIVAHESFIPTHNAATEYRARADEVMGTVLERGHRLRLRDLLVALNVETGDKVNVGQFAMRSFGSTEEKPRVTWTARSRDVTLLITPRDANLLLQAGATHMSNAEHVPPPER